MDLARIAVALDMRLGLLAARYMGSSFLESNSCCMGFGQERFGSAAAHTFRLALCIPGGSCRP